MSTSPLGQKVAESATSNVYGVVLWEGPMSDVEFVSEDIQETNVYRRLSQLNAKINHDV